MFYFFLYYYLFIHILLLAVDAGGGGVSVAEGRRRSEGISSGPFLGDNQIGDCIPQIFISFFSHCLPQNVEIGLERREYELFNVVGPPLLQTYGVRDFLESSVRELFISGTVQRCFSEEKGQIIVLCLEGNRSRLDVFFTDILLRYSEVSWNIHVKAFAIPIEQRMLFGFSILPSTESDTSKDYCENPWSTSSKSV